MNEMEKLMHEAMVDAFLDVKANIIDDCTQHELLMEWVTWIDEDYKALHIPDVCWGVLNTETGDVVSIINEDLPDAREQAQKMCDELNHKVVEKKEEKRKQIDPEEVINSYLRMDEEGFMDFLMNLKEGGE